MIKSVIIPAISLVLNTLINKIPETWKIIIGVAVVMFIGLFALRSVGIQESRAYTDQVQKINDARFENVLKENERQFDLLRGDINSLKSQNNEVIKLLINK